MRVSLTHKFVVGAFAVLAAVVAFPLLLGWAGVAVAPWVTPFVALDPPCDIPGDHLIAHRLVGLIALQIDAWGELEKQTGLVLTLNDIPVPDAAPEITTTSVNPSVRLLMLVVSTSTVSFTPAAA